MAQKVRSLYFTNRKEYYRRKKISNSLKAYYSNQRILKAEKEATTKALAPLSRRSRQQVAFNSDYNISLRAISFNNKFTEKELEDALQEFLSSNDFLRKIPFDVQGIEDEEIDNTEDKGLDQNSITIELNVRGKQTVTRI